MKQSILLSVFALLGTTLFAQHDPKAELAIKKVIQQQGEARNKQDWDALGSSFTDDGILINPVGQFWKGRREIVAHLKELSACCLEPILTKVDVKTIRFLTPVVAIVYTEVTEVARKDFALPFRQYKKGDTDYSWKTDVFIKQNDEWKITTRQVTLINQLVSPHHSPDKN
ncbi:SgcJ/EcaC family oxidoreductase [Spirosoma sp. HMF4905]|uniref:SgcJ/EcaC family oxidoreductase n=1 Tax=Spirosoma arboris TaxID=2682092 RepID=A0A7K1SR79_9BACT|nr:SgcJ/EcaC family oxidoreductase [Spirosoma arboris]MVM36106.1 SgcJ/EcaC family oxidoreductase [Spirosoma arboris]